MSELVEVVDSKQPIVAQNSNKLSREIGVVGCV